MKILRTEVKQFGIELSDEKMAQFEVYRALLIEWNQRVNLTRIVDPDAIEVRHFLDAVSCVTVTGDLNQQRIIDVGTGAGFPGLPLKIVFPQMQLTLVESVGKKVRFLEAVAAELGLKDVTIINGRAEVVGQSADHREQYDWSLARAVAHLRVLAEYLLPLVKVGGSMLAQKGEGAERESAEASHALTLLGGSEGMIRPIQLPTQPQTHYLLTSQKISPTPPRYPRRTGIPSKRPL